MEINKKTKKEKISRKKGFVLLLSVLISSILLAIGLGVFNITLKGMILASTGKESKTAFFAADSGGECALYWDVQQSAFDTASQISCNSQNFSVGGNSSTFLLYLDTLLGENGPCAEITVTKTFGLATTTTVQSRGYNTCNQDNPRRVERGIRIRY